jgi:hypothetical protein
VLEHFEDGHDDARSFAQDSESRLEFRAVSAEMAKRIQGSSDADAEALEELPDDAERRSAQGE